MKRTTIFLNENLEALLQETSKRTRRPQAEIVRDALTQYFESQPPPWPSSIGMGDNSDRSVTSENVKDWVRERWQQDLEESEKEALAPPTC